MVMYYRENKAKEGETVWGCSFKQRGLWLKRGLPPSGTGQVQEESCKDGEHGADFRNTLSSFKTRMSFCTLFRVLWNSWRHFCSAWKVVQKFVPGGRLLGNQLLHLEQDAGTLDGFLCSWQN